MVTGTQEQHPHALNTSSNTSAEQQHTSDRCARPWCWSILKSDSKTCTFVTSSVTVIQLLQFGFNKRLETRWHIFKTKYVQFNLMTPTPEVCDNWLQISWRALPVSQRKLNNVGTLLRKWNLHHWEMLKEKSVRSSLPLWEGPLKASTAHGD